MKTIKHIIRGCGYLEHCGEHPGTDIMIVFVLMGALAGVHGGLKGALTGVGFMGIFLCPLYLCGAYERSVLDDELSKKDTFLI